MQRLIVKKLSPEARLPAKGNDDPLNAGYDLYACGDWQIPAHSRILIDTGIAMQIEDGYVGIIKDRSSMAVKYQNTHAGIIDANYRGHVKVLLHNNTDTIFQIVHHDRIAQIIFFEHQNPEVIEGELSDSVRGAGGFGSTGK